MTNRVRFDITANDQVSGKLARIRDNFDRLGKSAGFKSVAQGVGIGAGIGAWNLLSGAIGSAKDFMDESVTAASNLNESLSKSRVVFGAAATGIEKFGDSSAKSLGISKRAAIEAAATFGNFFVGLGKTDGEAANMSKRLVALAGDLASFNNLDPTETLDKLRAGLAGEAEPLRRVGVFLTEAKVKAKAMELGLADANGEISEGAKVTARYQIILDETTTAQGDFARTADGLANSQRTANAVMEDAQATLGQKMLPAQLAVTSAQIDFFTVLGALGDEMAGKTTPETIALTKAIGGLTDEEFNAKIQAYAMAQELASVDESLRASKRAALTTADAIDQVGDEATETADEMESAAEKMLKEYFEPILEKDRLAAEQAEVNAARRAVAAADAGSEERREASRTLRKAQSDFLTTAAVMLEAGKLNKKEQKALFDELDRAIDKSTGSAKADLVSLKRYLQGLTGTTYTIDLKLLTRIGEGKYEHRAGGGPVMGGTPYIVGERGRELFIPESNGTIVPNGASVGGGTQVIQLVVDGRVLAEVVNRQNHYDLQRQAPTQLPA